MRIKEFTTQIVFMPHRGFIKSLDQNCCNVNVNTVVPGFRALGPSTAKSALNPGSALFPRLDLEHFVL